MKKQTDRRPRGPLLLPSVLGVRSGGGRGATSAALLTLHIHPPYFTHPAPNSEAQLTEKVSVCAALCPTSHPGAFIFFFLTGGFKGAAGRAGGGGAVKLHPSEEPVIV